MSYRFSQNSLDHLDGVHPDLVRVAHRALSITPYDFGIIEGVRSKEEQKQEEFQEQENTSQSEDEKK